MISGRPFISDVDGKLGLTMVKPSLQSVPEPPAPLDSNARHDNFLNL